MEQMLPNEEWRVCPLDETKLVSNYGRVQSVARNVDIGRGATRTVKSKMLKLHILNTGYAQIVGAGRKKLSVHRMVASAFLAQDPTRTIVNHKNGIRTDNRVENLEWVNHSENLKHAYRELGTVNPFVGRTAAEHPKSKAVVAIDMQTGAETHFACALDAVRQIGADSGCISRACRGLIKHHRGKFWKFKLAAGDQS